MFVAELFFDKIYNSQMKKLFLLFLLVTLIDRSTFAQQTADTVMFQKDSAIIPETDPLTKLLQEGEKVAHPEKTMMMLKSGKQISMHQFVKSNLTEFSDAALVDLDNDGKAELFFSNYTGGAHCCDEIYIFKKIGINRYQFSGKMYAGVTGIDESKTFQYRLYELFGYFFTCYACGFPTESEADPIENNTINIQYRQGRLQIVKGDKELLHIIHDNLGKLKEQPYVALKDDLAMDEGLRKEFAFNLGVYYYAFGKNFTSTKLLFDKYYKFSDSKKVWNQFVATIKHINSINTF